MTVKKENSARQGIKTVSPRLGLADSGGEALTLSEYLTMTTQILSQISKDGSCSSAVHTVATSYELKREFISQITIALENFLKRSQTAPGETIVSWSHVTIDALKAQRRGQFRRQCQEGRFSVRKSD